MGKFYLFFLFVCLGFLFRERRVARQYWWKDLWGNPNSAWDQMCVQNTWGRRNKSWLIAAGGTAWNETCRFCMKSSLYLELSLMEDKKGSKKLNNKKNTTNNWASKHKICPTLCKRCFSSLNLNCLSVIGRSFGCKQFIIVDTPLKYLR